MIRTPFILLILDGFGISSEKEGNAVAHAHIPTLQSFFQKFPFLLLRASGIAVGLPWGVAGNSEVGHLTIGAGRVIYHDLPRIISSIHDGSFFQNPILHDAATHIHMHKSRFHIAGLISSGSVHSYIDHLYALFEFTKRENIEDVYVHVFTDGKDAPPRSAADFLNELSVLIAREWPHIHFASVIGRFFALDRDQHWERTKAAYDLLCRGAETVISSIPEYIRLRYAQNETDEFIAPAVCRDKNGAVMPRVCERDVLFFADFREDSMRQITRVFTDFTFAEFPRISIPSLFVGTLTEYQKNGNAHAAFPHRDIILPLSHILSNARLTQLHIAETQKYAHVTYFLNGGSEDRTPGEEHLLIPSLPSVHFNETPFMRTPEITDAILANLEKYDVIIANFANADMVGHSGDFSATITAMESIDTALHKIKEKIMQKGGILLITADHGSIEMKRNILSGEALTEHSNNPVPLFLIGQDWELAHPRAEEMVQRRQNDVAGILTDVAPTVLELLGLEIPKEITGKSLLSQLRIQLKNQ
ncbi:MAG: 2,3-bisphosphoglycerate-independent phosphoglycerate mutase [Parcubacteria group bacterium Gr01-1014_66]|nr:MAG: 2,3-bisphosphoglycerate-independent phosphoglycerate mutase [Parcubacteria group bacterium Gr01-1014_66]